MRYSRDIPDEETYDIVVVGAGPAGCCAAIAAARLGARTALIEKYGVLGGAMTIGGVPFPMSFHAYGRQVIAGIGWELIQRLAVQGWAILPDPEKMSRQGVTMITVDPVMTACMWDQLAQDATVDIKFQRQLVDVLAADGHVQALILSGRQGLKSLRAGVYIDATGDGTLSAWAGAAFEQGDSVSGELQPGTQGFIMRNYPTGQMDLDELERLYSLARKQDKILPGDYWCEGRSPVAHLFQSHGLNINHVDFKDLTDEDIAGACISGHQRVGRILQWARDSVPDAQAIQGAMLMPEPWIRESRRILGEQYITGEDYRQAKRYPDAVAYSFYPIDIHRSQSADEPKSVYLDHGALSRDRVPTIPAGAMQVRDFDNLLCTGRCISGDRIAQSAYRVQATCMGMGQAAGTMAALGAAGRVPVKELDIRLIRSTLTSQGAIVP